MKSIPQGWKSSLLSDFVEKLDAGVSVNSDDMAASNGQSGVLKISCVSKGIFNPKENKAILPDEVSKARVSPKKNCIIISRSNTQALVGASAYITEDHPNLFLPDTLWQTIYCKGVVFSPRWLSYWLQSPATRKRLGNIAAGTSGSMKKLSKPALLSIEVLAPSFREQEKIAEILTSLDSAIQSLENLLTVKTKLKRGLMQQLLTGKKRFPEFHRQDWIKVSAGEVFRNVSVKGNQNEELLSATQDKGIIPRRMLEARVTMPTGDTNSFKLVEVGNFVISLRSFQGGLEYSYYRGIVSPAYTVLKPKKQINAEFYKQYFKSYEFIGRLATAVIGIRDGKQVSYEDYYLVKIPFPSIEEQERIAEVLNACDKEIGLLKQQLDALKQQKRGLMQKLLTGQLHVKVDDLESATVEVS